MIKALGGFSKTRKLILPLVIAAASSALAFLLSRGIPMEISFLETAQMKTLDQRFEHRGAMDIKDSSKVVIVGITDQSSEALPAGFPFPHWYYARMIKNLFDAGAKAVGIDILFEDSSRIPGDDKIFSDALRKYKGVVLAVRSEIESSEKYKILKSEDFYHNIFAGADSSLGMVFVENDLDGVYRRYRPIVEIQAGQGKYKFIPSFAFAVLSQYLGLGNQLAVNHERYFEIGNLEIPKYDETSMLINYPGPSGRIFPRYDMWQVLDDSSFTTKDEKEAGIEINAYYDLKDAGLFKDKIVLVGAFSPESHDLMPISFTLGENNLAYGVEVHAAAIETVLDGDFLRRSDAIMDLAEMFIGAFLIALTSFVFKSAQRSRMLLVIFIPLLATIAVIFISFQAAFLFFDRQRIVLDVIYPVLGYVFGYVGTVVYQYVSERRQKAAIKSIFSRYVDPSVVNQLVDNPELVRLGGEKKTMSVLFSDIADFTGVSENLSPEELVAHLNEYLTEMTGTIFQYSGTLDKYIGDAIIAFWGAPIELKDHAFRACQTAMEMTRKLGELHSRWTKEGKPLLDFRIGINSGEMVVGNVGGKERFDYTVIGDNVNLASRLEGANKFYRTKILLSEFTHELVKEKVFARELDLIVVKGKTRPVKIYELLSDKIESVSKEEKELVDLYCFGISKYRNREWGAAADFFEKVISLDPSDYPSEMYLERSKVYEIDPPPDDWNGVFVMETK